MRLVLALLTLWSGHARPPKSARDLIQAMHDRYAGKWYRTLSFTQHNTATHPDGTQEHSTWREYAALPGRLRIDFLPADSGQGYIFRSDSIYVFKHDSLVSAAAFIHPLLVLGFDVYFAPVDSTVAKLAKVPFDLSVLHEDTWQGRPVWVVGAPNGDLHHSQFWVDQERLVFVRMLQPGQRDTARTSESVFDAYQPLGGTWVSPRVAFTLDGKPVWLEEYVDLVANGALDDAVFDPAKFGVARPRH
ncbi:MAG TPA: hypothetical protein VI160_11835 [Gemmatimonadales bacterium]